MSDVERLLAEAPPRPWSWTSRREETNAGIRLHTDIRSNEPLGGWPFTGTTDTPKKAFIQHESWYVQPSTAALDLLIYAVNHVEASLRLLSEAENLVAGFTPSDNAQCRSWLKEVDEFLGRTVPA